MIEDLDGALLKIRELWEGSGWDVSTRQIGAVKGLSATIIDGSSIYVLSGPGGTNFNGETLCARIAGAPTASNRPSRADHLTAERGHLVLAYAPRSPPPRFTRVQRQY